MSYPKMNKAAKKIDSLVLDSPEPYYLIVVLYNALFSSKTQ